MHTPSANTIVACRAAFVLMVQNLQHGARVRAHLVTFHSAKMVIHGRTFKRPLMPFFSPLSFGAEWPKNAAREESLHKKPTSAFTHF
jgi:hypothetical protein